MTSSRGDRQLHVVFSKRRNPGLLFGRTPAQLGLLTVALFAVVGALNATTATAAVLFVAVAVLLVAAALVEPFGRPLADFVPALIGDGIVRLVGARRYRGGPDRTTGAETGQTQPRLPGSLGRVVFEEYDVGGGMTVGVARDTRDGTVTGVLEVAADTFATLSGAEQARRAAAFQAFLDGLARPDSPVVAVQLLGRVLPDAGDEVHRQWRTRGVHTQATASAIYEELLRTDSVGGWRHESYVAIRLDPARNRTTRALVRDLGGVQAGAAGLLWQWMTQAHRDLREAGLRVAGWLPPRGVAAVIRTAFAPDSASTLARRGGGEGDVAGGDDGLPSGVDPAACGPMYAEAAMSYYAHNNVLSRTWWITEWPRRREGKPVGFLSPLLLEAACRHTVSLTLTPLPGKAAQRSIDLQASTKDAQREMNTKAKRRIRRADQREEADIDRRESELVEGYSQWRITGLVTATAHTRGDLETASAEISSAMNSANVEGAIWYLEQDQAFWCGALPLARTP